MSTNSELLRELVARFNQRQPIDVAHYFAPTFQLKQPGRPNLTGLAGAQAMTDALYALGENVRLEILALVEQGDLVAVRWQVAGLHDGASAAMMAMYRFEAGRIVDDWGVAGDAPWPP